MWHTHTWCSAANLWVSGWRHAFREHRVHISVLTIVAIHNFLNVSSVEMSTEKVRRPTDLFYIA